MRVLKKSPPFFLQAKRKDQYPAKISLTLVLFLYGLYSEREREKKKERERERWRYRDGLVELVID